MQLSVLVLKKKIYTCIFFGKGNKKDKTYIFYSDIYLSAAHKITKYTDKL